MPNYILLVGAGATSPLGYPLMGNLSISSGIQQLPVNAFSIPELQDALMGGNAEIANKAWDYFRDIAEHIDLFIQNTANQPTFEAAIDRTRRYQEIIREIAIDPNLSDAFIAHYQAQLDAGLLQEKATILNKILYKVLLNEYGCMRITTESQKQYARKFVSVLSEIASLNKNSTLNIYTTNYDIAWESLASVLGDSFPFYDLTIADKASKSQTTRYSLFRLHGCVRYYPDGETFGYLDDNQIDRDNLEINYDNNPADYTRIAIKVGEGEPDLTKNPFMTAFSSFEKDLSLKNTICVVIGFSFRDKPISHLIFDAIDTRTLSRIICVDPSISSNDVYERLCKAGGHSGLLFKNIKSFFKSRKFIHNYSLDNINFDKIDYLSKKEESNEAQFWHVKKRL